MILKADEIRRRLVDKADPLVITPRPSSDALKDGAAAVDLRLGTWFMALRPARMPSLEIGGSSEARATKTHYVKFGDRYYLHPGTFALGVTLEWVRLPRTLAGYVVGKSSWGRRGLIIATAVGVHPGFTGCLTLELANTGEMPIAIEPGMRICQLFLHSTQGDPLSLDESALSRRRKPALGAVSRDSFCEDLRARSANLPPDGIVGAFFGDVVRAIETTSIALPHGQADTIVGFLMSKGSSLAQGASDLLTGNVSSGTIFRIDKKGLLLSIPGTFAAATTIAGALSPLAPLALGLGVLLAIKEIRDAIDILNDEQASVIWTLYLRSREPITESTLSLSDAVNQERTARGLASLTIGRIETVLEQLVAMGIVTSDSQGSHTLKEWFLVRQI